MDPENKIKKYILEEGNPYWTKNEDLVGNLELPANDNLISECIIPPRMRFIQLPDWACDIGVDGKLAVPQEALSKKDHINWKNTNWFFAAFWYLSGIPERLYENANRPIHSYSNHLKDWPEYLWEYAWCNRIFLFMRRWAAHKTGKDEETLYGPLPQPCIVLTHDVDAIQKTVPTKLKQTIFNGYNSFRMGCAFKWKESIRHARKVIQCFTKKEDYWCFDRIQQLESEMNVRSIFNFSGLRLDSKKNETLKCRLQSWLMDPLYDVNQKEIKKKIHELLNRGWQVGLHPSFDSWDKKDMIFDEKKNLEHVTKMEINACRQHWLRFSWEKTWQAQETAGLKTDMTIGFNDRPGFRSSVALEYHPWNPNTDKKHRIKVIPTVLMDSHLYDYKPMENAQREKEIAKWIGEIKKVGGTAAVIWHQRVFSPDYGWQQGYEQLLSILSDVKT